NAMALQISKDIAQMAASACGDVEAILLTGGIAHGKPITDEITRRIGFIAPVHVYAGEDELTALAEGAHRVLTGYEEVRIYVG
ncbi:MAG: butyrate kinase, partial [Defluviitaleaceae bacterium]|nr:butyrate kinase [Defluviitaleaceae bacterium]